MKNIVIISLILVLTVGAVIFYLVARRRKDGEQNALVSAAKKLTEEVTPILQELKPLGGEIQQIKTGTVIEQGKATSIGTTPSQTVSNVAAIEPLPGTITTVPTAETNEMFVKRMYRTYAQREGDTGGIQFWTNKLNAGNSKTDVENEFKGTEESQATLSNMILAYWTYSPNVQASGDRSWFYTTYKDLNWDKNSANAWHFVKTGANGLPTEVYNWFKSNPLPVSANAAKPIASLFDNYGNFLAISPFKNASGSNLLYINGKYASEAISLNNDYRLPIIKTLAGVEFAYFGTGLFRVIAKATDTSNNKVVLIDLKATENDYKLIVNGSENGYAAKLTNESGVIYAVNSSNGIFALENGAWKQKVALPSAILVNKIIPTTNPLINNTPIIQAITGNNVVSTTTLTSREKLALSQIM